MGSRLLATSSREELQKNCRYYYMNESDDDDDDDGPSFWILLLESNSVGSAERLLQQEYSEVDVLFHCLPSD